MTALYIVIAVVVLLALAWWVVRSRDAGTHDPVAFADPTADRPEDRNQQ